MSCKNILVVKIISVVLLSLFLFSFLLFTSSSILAEDNSQNVTQEIPTPGLGAPTFEVIKFDYQEKIGEFVKYVIVWAFRLAGVFAFIMILFAGFQYLTAGGNTNQQKEAQERIFNAIIGIILLFSFWLILNTINPDILKPKTDLPSPTGVEYNMYAGLTEQEKQDILAAQQQLAEEAPQQIINFVLIGPDSNDYANIPLSYELLGYNAVYIDQKTAAKLSQLAESAPKGWTVTEACVGISSSGKCVTTYGGHSSLCHDLGTCVDIGFGGDPGDYIRTEFIYTANQAGFDVIDEYSPAGSSLGSGFHLEINMSKCSPTPPYYCI
jgi:hypothetical protein